MAKSQRATRPTHCFPERISCASHSRPPSSSRLGKRLCTFALPALISISALLSINSAYAQTDVFRDKLISIGTASRSGLFFPTGAKICELVNRDRKKTQVRCVAYPTPGSEYNAKAVTLGDFAIGMTRSDIAYNEFVDKSSGDGHGDSLRAVMSLYAMPVVIIARRKARIDNVTQLKGHSINLGNRGSGQRAIVDFLMKTLGLKTADFSAVSELATSRMGDAFCAGKIDVVVEALGHPAPFYRRMIEECDGQIVGIPEPLIDKIAATNLFIDRLPIPGGMYANHPDAIPSFGYKALLVTRQETSEEAVQRFVGTVMERLSELKQSDLVLQDLEPERMLTEGITVPLHPGAARYLNTKKTDTAGRDHAK
ncbi:TAXI family TRAP transporter solute-binding subunit [soil metagenome]